MAVIGGIIMSIGDEYIVPLCYNPKKDEVEEEPAVSNEKFIEKQSKDLA